MGQTDSTAPSGTTLVERHFEQDHLAHVRADIRSCGAAHGFTDVKLAHVVLAVNEIATNAVRHAGGRGWLRLSFDRGALWCEVVDEGSGIAPHRLARLQARSPDRIGGHGLWLARHISDDVEIETSRAGTRVVLRFVVPVTDGEGR